MEKEFIPYEQASKLKALGFKERCLTYYGENKPMLSDVLTIEGWDYNTSFLNWTSRPTFQQAFRWFREEYEIPSFIQSRYDRFKGKVVHRYSYGNNKIGFLKHPESVNYWEHIVDFDTYEEAELECLDKLIELVETKTN
jgi:hypothetical protein